MAVMTFTVTIPDDTIAAERINHDIICEEVRGAVIASMILEDNQVPDIYVVLRKIEDSETFTRTLLEFGLLGDYLECSNDRR